MSHPILRNRASRKTEILLWTIQGLLAAIFLFAGGMKLVMPIAELTKQMPLPALFLRFIGVAEVSGAFGLILPGALRIRTDLTSWAAAGLVVIMIGATGVTLAANGGVAVLVPVVVGILAAFIAVRRMEPFSVLRSPLSAVR